MTTLALHSPVNLRKNNVPLISIYGDTEDRTLTKRIWSIIPGHDVRVTNPQTPKDLYAEAYNSAIVFVVVNGYLDKNMQIAEALSQQKGVVADIIAITPEPNIRHRLHILSAKFDAIYNLDILKEDDFAKIITHKLKKGMMRLNARVQEDEYETFLGFLSVCADAFIVFDTARRIFYVSDLFLQLFPQSADNFTRGTPVHKVFEAMTREMGLAHTDARYWSALSFWETLSGTHEWALDGGVHYRMTAVALPNGQGTILSATNVTAYKEQERALEKALSAEQEASSLQKQFISMVSHEFRTPLAIVDGNAQILERRLNDMPEDEAKKRLKTIRSAVSRTVNMMEAVLSSNLLKTGRLDVHIEETALKSLIKQLCHEQADLARDHTITMDLDDLPESVPVDRKIMTLVLTNLLSNAVKYSYDNPRIHVTGFQKDKVVVIQVKDNGVGIPKDEIPKIFTRFYRATTSAGIAGSGVGLSLVKDLVEVHGGKAMLDSDVGQGTTVTIYIPLNFKRD